MIISRTPLRMSFVGGGSDIATFYREHGGAVLSTAIDKYIYVTVNKKFDSGIRVAYSVTEEVEDISLLRHALVRESMRLLEIDGGIEITTVADIPSRGTGLGSSSTFTAGLLNALYAFKHQHVSSETLGRQACEIEIDICGEPIGKQDQYAAAFGGLNLIEFLQDDSVKVSPVICQPSTVKAIQDNTLMFYSGLTRSASEVLKQQTRALASDQKKIEAMKRMVSLAYTLRTEVQANNILAFGEILNENWQLKKEMAGGITNPAIDEAYDSAMSAGASGGKLLGAGAGGFLMMYAPPEKHARIRAAIPQFRPIDVNFEPLGSQIIFYH